MRACARAWVGGWVGTCVRACVRVCLLLTVTGVALMERERVLGWV